MKYYLNQQTKIHHQIKIEYKKNFSQPCFDSSKSYFYDANPDYRRFVIYFNKLLRNILVPKVLSLSQALKSFNGGIRNQFRKYPSINRLLGK